MDDLRITIIQSSLHWENIDQNLEMFSRKITAIQDTDLIVLPEMFNTGFTMNTKGCAEQMHGKTMQWMQQKSKEKNCVVVGSLIIEEKGNYFNRLLWIRPDGTFEVYDKRHLFRYGKENEHFAIGTKRIITEIKGWKICPLVCYDLRFPVWSRNKFEVTGTNVKAEYDLLLYIANWPERRNHPWKTLLMARAIENQAFVVGLNRVGNDGNEIYHSGDSAIHNFKGEQLSTTKAHEETVETVTLKYAELEEFRKIFPVGMDADEFEIKH